MGVTTYYSAGGELLGHRTDVGAAYGPDALGSVKITVRAIEIKFVREQCHCTDQIN